MSVTLVLLFTRLLFSKGANLCLPAPKDRSFPCAASALVHDVEMSLQPLLSGKITRTCCLGRHCSGPSGALPMPFKDEGSKRKCRDQLVSFDTWIYRGPERGRDLPMSQNRLPADLGP